jgi:5-methylcytosine-specific restriction endonuclease McrA
MVRVAKLTSLRPRLSGLRSRIASAPVDRVSFDRQRDQRGWRKWYKTARWQRLRMSILRRDLFTCQWRGCGRVEADTSLLVADHRKPHRGDEALFWDADNLWCLCKRCHDSLKQRQERRDE